MDLIPKPDQVVSAAGNVAHKLLRGQVADLRPLPRALVDEGMLREVHHYRTPTGVTPSGDPVLVVAPLGVPARCYDLRRGCSFVEHLVQGGRRTYLVEYGEVPFANRTLGLDHWVDDVVPQSVRAVSAHAGGRPVHLVGWGLGGLFSLLTSADRQDLPIGSLTLMGTPVDLTEVPLVAPWHSLVGEPDAGVLLGRLSHLVGGVPEALVRRAAALPGVDRIVTRPLALATRLDDTDFLAQVEAMDRLTQHMSAYPGRTYGQLYHRFLAGNQLATGVVRMADRREIRLSEVRVPVLVLAGEADTIAPVAAVRPLTDLLTGARSTRLEVVPGGHLGLLTGRTARSSTWPSVDAFLDGPAAQTAARRRRTPAKRTARSRKPAPSADRIGANPARRYGSATSRSLAART